MTKQEMLNGMSEAEFYALYPTKEAWEAAQQEMAYGGSPFIQGFPFGAGITMASGGTPYYGGPIRPAQDGAQMPVKWPTFKTASEHDRFVARDPNLSLYSAQDLEALGLVKPQAPNLNAIKKQNQYAYTPAGQAPTGAGLFNNKQGQQFTFSNGTYNPYDPTTTPVVTKKFGGLPGGINEENPCYDCGGSYMEDGGNASPFNYGAFPAMQDGGDQAAIWLAQQQLALQNRTRQGIPSGVKPTGTNPLNFNPYLKGSDISQPDSIHTNPFDPKIAAYFKGNKMIAGPAENSGPAINAARKINTGKFYKKDDEIFPDYVSQRAYGGAFDNSNNQNYPTLDNGGDYSWIKDTINQVNSKKHGGDTTEQGGNQDFLTKRNDYVKNYMKNMVEKNIRQEESEKVKNAFIQMDSQLPPIGAPTMAYGGYIQMGGPGMMSYHQPYDQIIQQNEMRGMMAQDKMASMNDNRTEAWQNLFDSFQDGGGPQSNETWEQYQERLNEEKAGKEGGRGRMWDGTKWVKAPAATQTQATEGYNPWGNLAEAGNPEGHYSNYIPDNDIRSGYRFGKKDFAELSKLNPDTKLTGMKMNYGPLGRVAPRLFGPKSVTFGTMGKYEDNMQMKDVHGNDQKNFKKSTYGDGQGPYPETERQPMKKPAEIIPPSADRQKAVLNMANPFNAHNVEMYNKMPKGPELDPFNNPEAFKQGPPRNGYGGLNKFVVGGPEDPEAIDMQPEYLQPKSSIGLFHDYADAELKKSMQATEDAGLRNPDTNSSDVYKEFTAKRKTTGVGMAAAKRSALIADTISSGLEQRQSTAKQQMKNSQYAMNRFQTTPANTKNEGDYDLNSGMFRPDQDVPVQFAGYAQWGGFNTMQNGGINMRAGLYGTNGNNQFTHNAHLESGKISQQPTETRDTLGAVNREDANLEAERGETAIVNIDGMPAHFKIGGKRHSEGGTPLNLPDNSFIFSDTAKMKIKDPIILAQFGMVPKKAGYTPAEIAKKYDINKFRKTLAEPNSEKLDRDTAEMMISNYNLKLAKLAMIQESAKGFPQGIPVIAMPYIMENEIDPSTFLPDQAEEQQEQGTQPDNETGEARYGANVISQWNRRYGGGLPFAQTGGEGEEPGFWSKVGHGVLDVLEAPQKAMMYAGTGLFGDREHEVQNPKTGETKWVSENNLPMFTKPNAAGDFWQPTGQTQKAHYEMPGESLKRTHPNSSPFLQGALDIVADPFLVSGLAKSGARLAVKKITEEAAEQAVKGTLKNTTIAKGVQSVLLNSGKKATVKNIKIAEKAIDAAQKSVDAGKAAKAFTTARKAGAKELMKQDLKQAGKVAEKYVGKPVVEGVKTLGKGAKYLGEKAVELAKNVDVPSLGPLGVPLLASAARNVSTLGLKEDLAKSKAENIRLKESTKTEKPSYRPLRTENGIGVFSNTSTPGAEYMYQNGQYVPYTPARRDSVLVAPPKGKKDSVNYDNMSVEELKKLLGE